MGTADRSPMGELGLRWGPAETQHGATVYHRLEHTSDWEDPFGLSASLASLVSGNDRGEYFRATGAEVWTARRGERGSLRGRFFAERHGRVDRSTHFHLTRIFDDDSLRSNLAADEQDRIGIAAGLKGHLGMDPEALRLFGSLLSESAIGEPGAYLRVGASGGFAVPLGPVQLGLEAGAGAGWGPLPVQRRFFLGGPATVRGVRSSSLQGESFWFGRLEMSRGEPAGRITVFGDLGWAGPKDAWGSGTPIRSVGAGISLLDGLVRMDLARNLDASAWRLHAYLDGIL